MLRDSGREGHGALEKRALTKSSTSPPSIISSRFMSLGQVRVGAQLAEAQFDPGPAFVPPNAMQSASVTCKHGPVGRQHAIVVLQGALHGTSNVLE